MPYKDISPEKFKELITKGDHVILDVRAESEYAEGQIQGHILIDYFKPDFEDKIKELDHDANYLVYCRGGIRSAKACEVMEKLGFTGKLYNLEGGITAWNQMD